MNSTFKKPFDFIRDIVDTRRNFLTRFLPSRTTLPESLEAVITHLTQKFPCKVHKGQLIKFFTTELLESGESLFCDECLTSALIFNPPENSEIDLHDIQKLPDYLIREYEKIREVYDKRNFNKVFLTDFIHQQEKIMEKVSSSLQEKRQQFAAMITGIIDQFQRIMTKLLEEVNILYDKELVTFSSNVIFISEQILNFLKVTEKYESTPTESDIFKSLKQITTSEQLGNYLKSETLLIGKMNEKLTDFLNAQTIKYDYTIKLLRKTYEQIKTPPTIPQYLELEKEVSTTNNKFKYLRNVLKSCEELTEQKIQLINPFQTFSNEYSLDLFINNRPFRSDPLKVEKLDYFYPNVPAKCKNLHFYDHHKRILHLVNIPELDTFYEEKQTNPQQTPYFLRVSVVPEIKIPRLAKTLTSPFGDIYFIGGENSDSTICFSPIKDIDSFRVRANMHSKKFGHGLMIIGSDVIFSIGGYDCDKQREGQTVKCEKYLINQDKWVEIASLKHKANYPGICSFDEKFIFKFGGYENDEGKLNTSVERYSVEDDLWTQVEVKWPEGGDIMLEVLPKCWASQINEMEILVVGGMNRDFLYTDEGFVMRLMEENESNEEIIEKWKEREEMGMNNSPSKMMRKEKLTMEVVREETLSLPCDGRMVSFGTLFNNKIYALLIKMENEDFHKEVVVYDGGKWALLL